MSMLLRGVSRGLSGLSRSFVTGPGAYHPFLEILPNNLRLLRDPLYKSPGLHSPSDIHRQSHKYEISLTQYENGM